VIAPLNIYHKKSESEADRPPIRLSYHFQSHYNSIIVPRLHSTTLLTSRPGEVEDRAIARSNSQRLHPDEPVCCLLSLSVELTVSDSSWLELRLFKELSSREQSSLREVNSNEGMLTNTRRSSSCL
jgi:hypothetical protein